MYLYQSATLRKMGRNAGYQPVDVSLVPLATLFAQYQSGHIELRNTALSPDPMYVDLTALRQASLPFYNLPFETWLSSLGNTLLPVLAQAPVYAVADALYADAYQARYIVGRSLPNDPYTVSGDLNAFTDAKLTKPSVPYDQLRNRVLATVNGFLHPTYGIDEYLMVKDAARSIQVAGDNHIGLWSFAHIGNLVQLPITEGMLSHLREGIPYKQSVVIRTGLNLTDKSVLVSIGGYAHINDRVVDILNASVGLIKINMEYLSLPRRVMELRNYIDISSLGLTHRDYKPAGIAVAELESNAFITKLLTLVQSFVVVIDAPILAVDRVTVASPGLPGYYEHGTEPLYPLVMPSGRFNEYWAHCEYGKYVLSVADTTYREYTYETTEWVENRTINERVPVGGYSTAIAQLLKVQSHTRT